MKDSKAWGETINRLVRERLIRIRAAEEVLEQPMTQAEFAELAGVGKSMIANIENGRQGASLATLYQIAEALRLEIGELLPSLDEVALGATPSEDPSTLEGGLPEWADWIEKSIDEWNGGKR